MSEIRFPLESLQRFAFTDPASGRQAKSKVDASRLARQAIVVIGVDFFLRVFLLFAWAGRLPTSRYIKKLLDTHERYKPRVFGIEANAMQSLFAEDVRDRARERLKGRITFTPIQQTTRVDKDWRIVSAIEPVLSQGRLFFMEDQHEAMSELSGHPTARFKDLIDALASAIALIPRKPIESQKSSEREYLAAYLRQTGCPAHKIERYLEEMK